MLTLNAIKIKLKAWFAEHAQINDVRYEDDFSFNAERNLSYPVTNIEFLDAAINNTYLNYNFKVSIGDMTDPNQPHQVDDVYSDSILVAEDFFAYLQREEGWVFNKSTSIQKFTDDTGDRVAGIVFRITLSVVRSQNTCATPTKITEPPAEGLGGGDIITSI